MNKLLKLVIIVLLLAGCATPNSSQSNNVDNQVGQSVQQKSNCHHVNGYTRKNGTYVSGYTRCR